MASKGLRTPPIEAFLKTEVDFLPMASCDSSGSIKVFLLLLICEFPWEATSYNEHVNGQNAGAYLVWHNIVGVRELCIEPLL